MPIAPFSTNPTDVDDNWRSLAELFGFTQGQPVRLVEGEIQVSVADARYRAQEFRPAATDSGVLFGVNESRTFGPNSPCRLDQVWLRENVAAAGAKVAVAGWVEA